MDKSGAAAAALAAMLYGSAYVAIAIGLNGFTPVGVAVWRGLIGGLVLGVLLLLRSWDRPVGMTTGATPRLALIGLFGGGIFVLAMNAAVALAGATVTAFVAGLYAVAAAVLAVPLLGERPGPRAGVALLVALVGTALLSEVGAGERNLAGVGMALVAAVAFGLFLVLSRRWAPRYGLSGPVVGLSSLSISALAALALAAVTDDPIVEPTPPPAALVAVAWLAVGPGALAAVLAVVAMRRLRAEQAALLLLLNPPTAAVLAYVLLDERLSPVQVGGAVLILAAIAVASIGLPTRTASRRSFPPDSAPPTRS